MMIGDDVGGDVNVDHEDVGSNLDVDVDDVDDTVILMMLMMLDKLGQYRNL